MASETDGIRSYRYERKFVVPFFMEPNVETILRSNRYGFHEIFAERIVNNIYFDTPMFRYYHENVQGVSDRKKVRIRWYGEGPPGDECRLEIKRKSGLVGTKDVYPIHMHEDVMSFGFMDSLALPPEVRFELGEVRPVLYNWYKRRYFLSADGRFRITIDHSLRYSHPGLLRHAAGVGTPDVMSVLELKYDRDADIDAVRIAADIPLSLSKKSKYVSGISAVYNG